MADFTDARPGRPQFGADTPGLASDWLRCRAGSHKVAYGRGGDLVRADVPEHG